MLSYTNHLRTVAFLLLVNSLTVIDLLSHSHSSFGTPSLICFISSSTHCPILIALLAFLHWAVAHISFAFHCPTTFVHLLCLYWSIVPFTNHYWVIDLPSLILSIDVLLLVLFLHWSVVLPSLADFWSTQLSLRIQRPTVWHQGIQRAVCGPGFRKSPLRPHCLHHRSPAGGYHLCGGAVYHPVSLHTHTHTHTHNTHIHT